MDTDKVIQDLNRRFAAPLPEFYQRRIILWYDEDKEFEDKLDEVVLENAKVIALTGNNSFTADCCYPYYAAGISCRTGIDVMTVGGVTFKRYLEIAQILQKETAVVTDNDGNIEAVEKNIKNKK